MRGARARCNFSKEVLPSKCTKCVPQKPRARTKAIRLPNSFAQTRSNPPSLATASGLLKKELDMLGCALLPIARECGVPSGSALSVDREKFSKAVKKEERTCKLSRFHAYKRKRSDLARRGYTREISWQAVRSQATLLPSKMGKLTGKDRLFLRRYRAYR